MNRAYILLIGFISGVVSGLASIYAFSSDNENFVLLYSPGVIFGIVLAIYFRANYFRSILKLLLFILSSTVAYYLSVNVCIQLADEHGAQIPFIIAGLIGGTILIASINAFIVRTKFLHAIGLVLLGGLLGMSFFFPYRNIFNEYSAEGFNENLFSLHVIWQTGMAFGIGLATQKILKKKRF